VNGANQDRQVVFFLFKIVNIKEAIAFSHAINL
jgi:hypothetical protein